MQFRYFDLTSYGSGHGKWCYHAPLDELTQIGTQLLALHKKRRIGAFKYQLVENSQDSPYSDLFPVCVVYAREEDTTQTLQELVENTDVTNPYWVSQRTFMRRRFGDIQTADFLKTIPDEFFISKTSKSQTS